MLVVFLVCSSMVLVLSLCVIVLWYNVPSNSKHKGDIARMSCVFGFARAKLSKFF